ncbi:hypothetical protein ASPZODRAFT_137257 [Penicilliopsis zonata CBS 506.65]|uniref:Rhodopsin domain-containing protein n=1 Tax=Penicilliopsis zonata CBS 506.65 TaxID=1073090 RepID=A0A1L9S5K6_9EURO|nr:hypothetical protein ASPZODRAFT_137257 [Penicilliopsis zonata CBS 506.65]OJJ42446.1 hypothetical protein ASPZODRAFT_137257 [Penicilliopsis zonata CBS 506.65]
MTLSYANRGDVVVVSNIILAVLAVVSSGLRFQTRIFYSKAFSWDDAFLAVSVVGTALTLTFNLLAVKYGYGQHVKTLLVTGPNPATALKYQIVSEATNMFAMMALKMSLGMSFVRLRLTKAITASIYGTMAVALLCNLCALIAILGQCRPMARAWDQAVDGTCWSNNVKTVTWYVQSAGNILSDLIFTVGPLVYISHVRVSKYNRWALRAVFCFGLLATVCGIVKTIELHQLLLGSDPTWDTVDLTIWYTAEMDVGIFAASLPALKARFEAMLFHFFQIKAGSSQYRSNHVSHTVTTRTGARGAAAGMGMNMNMSVDMDMDMDVFQHRVITHSHRTSDNDWASDRQILPSPPPGGISKTMEIRVTEEMRDSD